MPQPLGTTLFHQFQQGDQEALGRLLDHLRPYIRVIVRNMRGDRRASAVEDSDMIQDALLQATDAVDTFQGGSLGELIRWLRTIVVRTTYRTLHSVDDMTCTDQGEAHLATLVVDRGPAPADEAIRHEQAASMAVALSRLPEDMQQVLRYRLTEGLDYAAIADRLGRTSGASRMLYLRALRRLRDVWTEEFESR
jgi:RNA polymerase sigma-70 factor (ECF subfamily)